MVDEPMRVWRRISAAGAPNAAAAGLPQFDVLVLAVAMLAGALLVLGDVYQRWLGPHTIATLDIDGHNNPETWFHAAVLVAAAVFAFGVALTHADWRHRLQWLLLSFGMAFFSLDKTISLHERVGAKLQDLLSLPDQGGRIAWEIAWAPIILATVIVLVVSVWETSPRTQLFALGVIIAGGGKLALEAATFPAIHWFGASDDSGWFYGIEANVEETVQLFAFACLCAAFGQLFVDRIADIARRASTDMLDDGNKQSTSTATLPARVATTPDPSRARDSEPRQVTHAARDTPPNAALR